MNDHNLFYNNNNDILLCDSSYSSDWDSYLIQSQDSSFYQLFGWNKINNAHFGHKIFNLASVDQGIITGVFPLVLIKSKVFGKILCSMPFVNFGGPCANTVDIEEKLLDSAIDIAKQENVDYMEIRAKKMLNEDLPTSTQKISMSLNLDDDPDIVWGNFTSKHRTNIRRVYKNNISVKSGGKELLSEFYYILSESWRFLGTPIYRKEYFNLILDTFPDNTRIFVCYHNGTTPIASAFNGYFNGTVEGMWAGLLANTRKLQPNYALYWEMIKHACENQYKYYNLGRSSVNSGGELFKKKWKADTNQLYWQYYLHNSKNMPELNVNNPKYSLAIKTWRKLPTSLTTLIGPLVAKSIP